MIELDPVLVKRIKALKLEYTDEPQPKLLIALPNRNPDVDYEVEIITPEFTSLCPLNLSQPDYSKITIRFRPDKKSAELKSLKYYLASFRQVPIFHEMIPPMILTALKELIDPYWITVQGEFTVRGGLATNVMAEYYRVEAV